ncbi:trypsin-like peptidase domain-containing protein [Streptomyces bobili]
MPSTKTGIPLARVVAVIATLADGREQFGSGFLVEGRRVLTAEHCTRDKKTAAAPHRLRVVRASDGAAAMVDDVVAAPGLDVAVLHLTDAPGEADVPALVFARVARTHSGVLRDCAAIGFPLFQRDPDHSARHHAELHGTIYQTEEHETGRLLMREPLLTHLEPPDAGQDGQGEPTDPVWGGLSGALVFHAGQAIGVIVEHHPRQGPSAVQMVAFDTLHKHAETDRDARQVADTLQLPPVEQLAVAAAEPVRPILGLVDVIDGTTNDLPRVADLDPYRLGTTSSDYGTRDTYGEHDPYVPRIAQEADTRLRAALEPARFVLLVGPAKVGKTRTAFEAIHATWQDARLAAPTPQRLAKLAAHPRLHGSSDPLVVWLDELDRFFTTAKPLTPAMLTAILARPGPTVVVATLRQEARLRFRAATSEITRDTHDLLEAATTIKLRSTAEDSDEQAAAQAAYPDQSFDGAGLAERLGYAPELLMIYHDSETGNPVLHAVVRTAIDWARTGLSRLIPEPDLLVIADSVLAEEIPGQQVTHKKVTAAIKEARRPLGSGTGAALLLTEFLSEPTGAHRIRGYRPYDYLVAADDGQTGPPRPVPEQSWQDALDRAKTNEAFAVGVAAYQRGNRAVSLRGFERTARAGNTTAMFSLGALLADQDPPDLEGARRWCEKAAQAGHSKAMFNLGLVLANRWDPPDLEGARRWWEKAAQSGELKAMAALGMLLMTRSDPPDLEGARHWLEKAARAGNTDAMSALGVLLADQWDPPDLKGARHWYEDAARVGDTGAMVRLGGLLAYRWKPPDTDGARHWWATAAGADSIDAMGHLGALLADQNPPDLEGARRWLEKAAQAGNTDAMAALGLVLADRWDPPDPEGARHWWEKAAQAGELTAMTRVGVLLADQNPPDLEGARRWLEKAAQAGNTDAMAALGKLLADHDPSDLEGVRYWWEKAAQAGQIKAMVKLGVLLEDRWDPPDLEGARHWYEEAAQAGHTDAMAFLGVLLEDRWDPPDPEGALHWYEEAAQAGHTGAMVRLGSLLAFLCKPPDVDGALRWWEEAALAGESVAMVNLGMALAGWWDPPDLEGARYWWEQAAQAGHTGAMIALGVLLAGRLNPPNPDGARYWWEQAAQAGRSEAMVARGSVLAVEGDMARARDFLQQAVQASHPGAGEYVAAVDDDLRIRNRAHVALSKRADGGDAEALNFLGILEWRAGNFDAAHAAWTSSRDAHDAVASILLRMTG